MSVNDRGCLRTFLAGIAEASAPDVGPSAQTPNPVLVAVVGLLLIGVLITLSVVVIAILSVVLKASEQRADGIRVLDRLGRMLEHVVDTVRWRARAVERGQGEQHAGEHQGIASDDTARRSANPPIRNAEERRPAERQ